MTTHTSLKDRDKSDPSLWPYSEASGIIDLDLAAAIRQWALTDGGLSEAQLHALSQRQALRTYIDHHIVPTLDMVVKQQRTPQEAEEAAKAVLYSGVFYGLPPDPREACGELA